MTTPQNPSNPASALANLDSQDFALIELLQAERFNLNALLNKQTPFHPAQVSILTLIEWVNQPRIAAAIDSITASLRALSAKADEEAQLIAKKSLTHALAVAASMIPRFDACPDDPEQAELFAKRTESLIRETRLIARTLLKLSPPPPPPRRARASSSPDGALDVDVIANVDAHDHETLDAASAIDSDTNPGASTHTDDAVETSNTPTRRVMLRSSRLSRNSRKPVFSPAEVAEILSALIYHEEDLKKRATPPAAA